MKKYRYVFNFVLLALLANFQIVWAQEEIGNDETEEVVVSAVNEELNIEIENYTEGVSVSEQVLRHRFAKLQNEVPMVYHASSHQFVEYFINRNPSFTKRMMARKPLYMPVFEKYLKKYGLPVELKYLSMIESGLDPRILSRVGAGGLWQFMPATGREFGLYQDKFIDERFDPEKATNAACRYLSQLYRIFGDWEMALASYNTGPGNLRRAMRRSGGNSFWTIYNALPKETRSYVPQFVAMTYLMNYGHDHGVFPDHTEYPAPSDTLLVNGGLNLEKFSLYSGVTLEELSRLNPQILKTEIPAYVRNFPLKVPSEKYTFVKENRLAIWDSCFKVEVLSPTMLAIADSITKDTMQINNQFPYAAVALASADKGPVVDFSDDESIKKGNRNPAVRSGNSTHHTVKRGETLSTIARKYKVNVSDLRQWNKLKTKSVIRTGQRLAIHRGSQPNTIKDNGSSRSLVAAAKEEVALANNEAVAVRETKPVEKPAATTTTQSKTPAKSETSKLAGNLRYHTVQKGDTLWLISQKYGLTIDKLKKANQIKGNNLKPGQKLIIKG